MPRRLRQLALCWKREASARDSEHGADSGEERLASAPTLGLGMRRG
jgi:hypothetical protein